MSSSQGYDPSGYNNSGYNNSGYNQSQPSGQDQNGSNWPTQNPLNGPQDQTRYANPGPYSNTPTQGTGQRQQVKHGGSVWNPGTQGGTQQPQTNHGHSSQYSSGQSQSYVQPSQNKAGFTDPYQSHGYSNRDWGSGPYTGKDGDDGGTGQGGYDPDTTFSGDK